MIDCFVDSNKKAIVLDVVALHALDGYLDGLDAAQKAWWQGMHKKPSHGDWLAMPDATGAVQRVIAVLDGTNEQAVWQFGAWVKCLPKAVYAFSLHDLALSDEHVCLAWGMGSYHFDRYREIDRHTAQLVWPGVACKEACEPWLASIALVRDLVNTPANDCHPAMLADQAKQLADEFDGQFELYMGDDLAQAFPAVHAVGRASDYPPRLVKCCFGKTDHPSVVLVGKGVCFDTGGLDLKPTKGMADMKKDMGGAAHALGLARYLLAMSLPIHLTLILPIVENSVSGNAYRPGDVIASRLGVSIEINNTDAEGRLILADALALACEDAPDLLIDFATLTGAQRVAMGPDIPSFFTDDEALAQQLMASSEATKDPLWPLPLYKPYKKFIRSDIADISNCADTPYGGAITAALFLQRFVKSTIPWVHFDLSAANLRNRPSHPKGGEAMAIRACAEMIKQRLLLH